MLNERIWSSLVAQTDFRQAAPPWVGSLLQMSFTEIQKLPPATDALELDTLFRPTLERMQVTSSYLEFLRTQIKLEPRGKEWSAVLQARLNSLQPYEGQNLYDLSIRRMHQRHVESCWAIFQQDDFKLVHFDCS